MASETNRTQAQIAKLQAKVQKLKAAEKAKLKKVEKQRHLIIGEALTARIKDDKMSETELLGLIDKYVIRAADRKLLGLEVSEELPVGRKRKGRVSAKKKVEPAEKISPEESSSEVISRTLPESKLDIRAQFNL
ncbi:MAG: hypothetical protein AAFW84_24355 [Cyanobacteria bacterium J06635_15]